MVDVASENSLIVELYGIGQGSLDGLNMIEQPSRVRVLLTEISHEDRVTNFKASDLDVIHLTRLSLSNSLGQIRPHCIQQ